MFGTGRSTYPFTDSVADVTVVHLSVLRKYLCLNLKVVFKSSNSLKTLFVKTYTGWGLVSRSSCNSFISDSKQ